MSHFENKSATLKLEFPPEIHVHVHYHGMPNGGRNEDHVSEKEFAAGLSQISRKFDKLEKLLMATAQQFQEGFAKIDAATTAIGKRIQTYIDKVNAGGMTAEQEAEALVQLGGVVGPLEAMAQDPIDPVPEPVPPDEPVPV